MKWQGAYLEKDLKKIFFHLHSLKDELSLLSARVISECQTAKLNEFSTSKPLEKSQEKKKRQKKALF